MRYADTRKQQTREKVVRAAAAAVRAKGPDGVGVAEIMAQAGLTHGGFYAHFPSKEALVAAAVEEAFSQGARRFLRLTEGLAADAALGAFIDVYLSMDHRNSPEHGCPVAALANDLPRQGPAVRAAFELGVDRLIAGIEAGLPEPEPRARRSLAISLVAEMAGAVALARGLSDAFLAAEVLEASRIRIRARAGLSKCD